ncbi:MAG: RimJ/RimL family protein N-acetyltransferase [Gammaproteobacteria bacterium]|nr:MAG: RimJ/RimL family protein N-acetyltransferase [Gammaproteobacteria bacterium]
MFTLTINTDLKLALVETSFAKSYYSIVCQQRDYLQQWLPWAKHANDIDFFLTFINKSLHDYADGKSLTCAIIYQDNIVGNISFNRILSALKKVEIGYWLRQDYRGKGIVTQSVSALIDYAFNRLDMQVVQISAAVDNLPSRRVCERLGFTLQGIIPHAENINGRVLDHAVYTLHKATNSN